MGFRAVVVTGIAGAFALALPGCQIRTDTEDCGRGRCEQVIQPRMEVAVSQQSASIAAIEIFRPWPFDGGTIGGCGPVWTGQGMGGLPAQPVDAEPVCLYPPPDAGRASEACAARYPCPPGGNRIDAGVSCRWAWIYLLADYLPSAACTVTVISTIGERQSLGVSGYWSSSSYRCHTSTPGQCVSITPFYMSPDKVTLTFAQPADGSPGDGGGGRIDGPMAVDAPDRVPDVADRERVESR